jgi:hypothetical protein
MPGDGPRVAAVSPTSLESPARDRREATAGSSHIPRGEDAGISGFDEFVNQLSGVDVSDSPALVTRGQADALSKYDLQPSLSTARFTQNADTRRDMMYPPSA